MIDVGLPERKVLVDGTKYHIHGLIHENPWIKINLSFKKIVAQNLKNMNVVCEDGFVSWVPHAIPMGEIKYFGFGKLPFFKKINFISSFIHHYLSSLNKKDNQEIIHRIKRMNSIEDLIEIKNELFLKYPDEPEGMNTLMKNKNSGTIDFPEGNIPLRVRRYIYESKTSLNHAQENNLKELHILVGCAHERPLEYLLSNKNILNKYSL